MFVLLFVVVVLAENGFANIIFNSFFSILALASLTLPPPDISTLYPTDNVVVVCPNCDGTNSNYTMLETEICFLYSFMSFL